MSAAGIENDDDIDENEDTEIEAKDPPEGVEVVIEDDEATAKVDTELEEAGSDEERAQIQENRRGERKTRTQRNRERVEGLERTVKALEAQNQELAQKFSSIQDANTGSQLAQIDSAIQQANNAADHFKSVIATAAANNDGKTIADATEYMIEARKRANQLSDFKNKAVRDMNAPKPLDSVVEAKKQAFLAKNTWFKGSTSTETDSRLMTFLDHTLANQGWNPATDEYWSELEAMKERHLPHRVNKPAPARTGNSPVPGGSQSNSTGNKNVFHLSALQVETMQAAGLWDDPVKRKSMIDQYRKYDQEKRKG